jgi:hypothetical protein
VPSPSRPRDTVCHTDEAAFPYAIRDLAKRLALSWPGLRIKV